MLMPLTRDRRTRDVLARQSELRALLDSLPFCLCAHRAQRCSRLVCPSGEECAANVRQTLHNLLYATLADFTHQDQTMRGRIPDEIFRIHAEEHADLSAGVTALIYAFSAETEIGHTLAGIEALSARIRHHVDHADAQLVELLRD